MMLMTMLMIMIVTMMMIIMMMLLMMIVTIVQPLLQLMCPSAMIPPLCLKFAKRLHGKLLRRLVKAVFKTWIT
eukprot:2124570-Karenia_brevis.AAC.1